MVQVVKTQRLSQQIAKQIEELIRQGQFSSDQRLPAERDFAKLFGVSRAPVREALRILEALGFVEVRAGKGTFLAGEGDKAKRARRVQTWLDYHRGELSEFFEVDEALTRKAAELTAISADSQYIECMKEAIADQENAILMDDDAQMLFADQAFHQALVEAAKNHFLEILEKEANRQLRSERKSLFAVLGAKQGRRSVKEHKAILEAIKMHDGEEAGRLAAQHVNGVKQTVLGLRRAGEL